jgi:hypothetical protein
MPASGAASMRRFRPKQNRSAAERRRIDAPIPTKAVPVDRPISLTISFLAREQPQNGAMDHSRQVKLRSLK